MRTLPFPKNWSPTFVACFTTPSLCSSKFHKYDNYDKAPCMMSSYPWYNKANLFARLFTCHADQTNSPPLPRHTNKGLLKCTFPKNLAYNLRNLKELYNQGIKAQVTTKDIKKEDRLCMKSPIPET